jgi:dihydroneopterin aldolase/2-amino-4-hydroxy-6-hydroxymethyldihydropteridine diphosphokinase
VSTSARLFLTGIHADGRHGARAGEKDAPQPFVVDLDLQVEVGADRIDATADYREIVERVRAVVEGGSFDLIESIAGAIADDLVTIPLVASARAVVHKPHAAVRLGIDGAAAAADAVRPPG